jgi:hypothetical protein
MIMMAIKRKSLTVVVSIKTDTNRLNFFSRDLLSRINDKRLQA